ncbi:hypothetical protein REJC140_03369 [Pseudorhizobium endolithicum]|uniref:Uncharacterized protein n=1 Tax=Pseudorhizobium endolithicum TaxID=1191678 RepID=A0ABN7JKW6_9HYPH|nr:hypothetical protein REJC140_03369 [Pseudorhizobium endolithicum]
MASARMRSCSAVRRRSSSDWLRWASASCSSSRVRTALSLKTWTARAIAPTSSARFSPSIVASKPPPAKRDIVPVRRPITPPSDRAKRKNPTSARIETTKVPITVAQRADRASSTTEVTSEAISRTPILSPEKLLKGTVLTTYVPSGPSTSCCTTSPAKAAFNVSSARNAVSDVEACFSNLPSTRMWTAISPPIRFASGSKYALVRLVPTSTTPTVWPSRTTGADANMLTAVRPGSVPATRCPVDKASTTVFRRDFISSPNLSGVWIRATASPSALMKVMSCRPPSLTMRGNDAA